MRLSAPFMTALGCGLFLVAACGGGRGGETAADGGPGGTGEVPVDSDYDHVVTLTGTQTGASVITTINALSAGSVLVRPLDESGATITDGMTIPRGNVTIYNLNLTGEFTFADGTVMWGVFAEPAVFGTGGADNWIVRDSEWSGGAGETSANGCAGNVYMQNFVDGSLSDPTANWLIEGTTFRNYAPNQANCAEGHSEALYIGARAIGGNIRNNIFTNSGNTSSIFFTWFGTDCTSYSQQCSPDDICVEDNTWNPTWGAYYDVNAREELLGSLSISIDPAQGASAAIPSQWERSCP